MRQTPVCLYFSRRFDHLFPPHIIAHVKQFVPVLVLVACVSNFFTACAAPTPAPSAAPPRTPVVFIAPTPTPTLQVMPTAVDTFYGAPASYARQLGKRTQTIRLGVSPDFATRPILPLYGLSLRDEKFVSNLFEAITYNHFFRWQEADWAKRAPVLYDDFKQRLAAGDDMTYPAMDTRNGGVGAHVEKIDPGADLNILFIPRHDGFVTFPGSPTDPGLSIKNTINPDGSLVVRVPLTYAQLITYKPGDVEIQNLARTALIIALMELGIPSDAIAKNDLQAINGWWETFPEKELHQYQYAYLKKLLTDDNGVPVLHLWDEKP
jgi:hypothetical protein